MSTPRVLIVDDEPDLVELVAMTLARMQLATDAAFTLAEAQRKLADGRYDLCLTDMRLPDGDGLDLVQWINVHRSDLPVAVISAHGSVEHAVRALKLGAFDFVAKPLDIAQLRKMVASALKLRGSVAGETLSQSPRLYGHSAPIGELRQMIARVARSQAPVHIAGESGTGKELVARLIHEGGGRREAPFVPVNCGAIPSELMESELFGHKRGSFTGAVADKTGLVQSAEGGTLFLDEVADLPLHMQVKLLRLIQEKTVRPVGEAREQAVDVRILSATHRKLADLVASGRFREDLFYRINVIELRVPPLRERAEDIPELAERLLRRIARRMEGEPATLADDALEAVKTYSFPGNVRELENVLERAVTLCEGHHITRGDLQLGAQAVAVGAGAVAMPAGGASAPLGDQLEQMERAAILKALEQTRFNKTAAAKLLGMSFRALRYKTKKLGID